MARVARDHTLHRCLPTINSLCNLENKNDQANIASSLNDETINFLCKCVSQLIKKPAYFNLDPTTLKKIRDQVIPEKKAWIDFANKKKSNRKKRLFLSKQAGGAFPLILASLVPAIVSLVTNLFKKK